MDEIESRARELVNADYARHGLPSVKDEDWRRMLRDIGYRGLPGWIERLERELRGRAAPP